MTITKRSKIIIVIIVGIVIIIPIIVLPILLIKPTTTSNLNNGISSNICPTGSSPNGTGILIPNTYCKCLNNTYHYNGTACILYITRNNNSDQIILDVIGYRCEDHTYYYNGTTCKPCPAGSAYNGTGILVPNTKCKCINNAQYYNCIIQECSN
jgi:hypothetical protein